jgi:hypothetical protein
VFLFYILSTIWRSFSYLPQHPTGCACGSLLSASALGRGARRDLYRGYNAAGQAKCTCGGRVTPQLSSTLTASWTLSLLALSGFSVSWLPGASPLYASGTLLSPKAGIWPRSSLSLIGWLSVSAMWSVTFYDAVAWSGPRMRSCSPLFSEGGLRPSTITTCRCSRT